VRWLLNIGLTLATSAIALLVAAILLDGFSIKEWLFPVVVVVYTLVSLIVRPLLGWGVRRWAEGASSLLGLGVTYVTLLVTDLLSDSLTIEGAFAWAVGTLIVWAAWVVTDLIIGGRQRRREERRRR
jgi:hypothetical protein